MDTIYFLNLESRSIFKSNVRFESGFKAPTDVRNIVMALPNFKYKRIVRHTSNRFWGVLELLVQFYLFFLFTPKNSIVFLQYPMVNIRIFKRLKHFFHRFRTIVIVHDLQSYRYPDDYSYRKDEIDILNSMACLIVHTESMKNELKRVGVQTKMVVLGVFDYILPKTNFIEKRNGKIVFAGGLNKSLFLRDFDTIDLSPYILYAYGAAKPDFELGNNIEYKGSFLPDDVSRVEGEWGLVWDGDSLDSCTGNFGEYLKIIAPHKLSLYIACGLKVIVWEKSAMADFVTQNKIGITISSLSQLRSKLSTLSIEDNEIMSKNLSEFSKKVREGKMLENAFIKAMSSLNS